MGLSEKTTDKLREESKELGSTVYEDEQSPNQEDITTFAEDDDPLSLVGDFVEDEKAEEAK